MRAGKLRFRIDIQKQVQTQDDYGEVDITWTKDRTVWADIQELSGSQYWNAPQVESSVSHLITTRFVQPTTGGTGGRYGTLHRLVSGDDRYSIGSVIDTDNRERMLKFYCTREEY